MLSSLPREARTHQVYRFGPFVLDLDRGSLSRQGVDVALRPKSFAVLCHLVRESGRLVTKEHLLESVWGHRYVTEGSLSQCLMDIRRALGDEAHDMIRTVPRRGFVFELPVTAGGSSEAQIAEPAPARGTARRAWTRPRALLSTLASILLALVAWWIARDAIPGLPVPGGPPAGARVASIVVLPFVDMSPEGDQEYFADGLSEELINTFTRIPGLQVIARTSSFAYKGRNVDVPTVAKRLGVTHVLEGSVRKNGRDIRITAQLVDASTNTHVWSNQYDRVLDDIFAVQGDIAESVSRALEATLPAPGESAILRTGDPKAYENLLQGRFFWRRQGPGDFDRAEEHYRRAVELDPDLAEAWVGLASVLNVRIHDGAIDPATGGAEQRRMLERALAINPDLAEAHARLAAYHVANNDRQRADLHWARAEALGQNSAVVLAMVSSWATWRGRMDEAIEAGERAVVLDPLAANFRHNLGYALLAQGRLEEAVEQLRQAEALRPGPDVGGGPVGRIVSDDLELIRILQGEGAKVLAELEPREPSLNRDQNMVIALLAQGRGAEAEVLIGRIRALGGLEPSLRLAEIAAFRGEKDEAFGHLNAIMAELNPDVRNLKNQIIPYIRMSVLLQPLRSDSRWVDLWAPWQARM